MEDREIRNDAKLKGDALTEEQHQELWDLRYPAGESKRMSLEDIAATEVPRICSRTCAPSTLSTYYTWAKLEREAKEAYEAGEQAKLIFLQKNPDASPESLANVGQMIFTNKSVRDGDLKGFVELMSLLERRKSREFNEKKFQESIKSKQEAGLDALYEEIKGDAKVEEAYRRFKLVLKKSWDR